MKWFYQFCAAMFHHWREVAAIAVGIEHLVIGIYVTVAHAGGLRTIKANFLGPKEQEKKV